MSFIKAISSKTLPLSRARLFSASPYVSRSVVESTKEAIEAANRTVGNAAAKGIENAESAAQTVKSKAGLNASKAEGSASEMTGEAKGKAQDLAGSAKGTASELAGEAKGKASELTGQAKGKVEEVKEKL